MRDGRVGVAAVGGAAAKIAHRCGPVAKRVRLCRSDRHRRTTFNTVPGGGEGSVSPPPPPPAPPAPRPLRRGGLRVPPTAGAPPFTPVPLATPAAVATAPAGGPITLTSKRLPETSTV